MVVIPCSFLQRDSLSLAGFVSPLHGLCWTQAAERVQLSGSQSGSHALGFIQGERSVF